jgi:hypothetical protein
MKWEMNEDQHHASMQEGRDLHENLRMFSLSALSNNPLPLLPLHAVGVHEQRPT